MDVAFVGQGSLVISGALDGTSRLWSADTGTQVAVAEHAGHVIAIDVSPGGEWAVVTGRQQTIAVWDIQKQRVVDELIGHFDVIRRAAFSPDGTLVATASEDRSARVWSVGGKSVVIQSTDRAGNVEYAGIDPDMRLLTHARDGTTTLWDTASGVELPAEPDEHIRRAVHWPKQLALTTTSTGHVIRSNETGESVARLDLLTQLRQAQFSRNGEQIVVSNLTDTFTVFDARTGELTTATKTPSLVVEATFSPDGSFVATAGEDGVLRVWEASGGALRFEVAGSESLESVAFSSDGSLVAAGAVDGTVRVWNTADRALVSSLEGHGGRVAPIQFTPKGSLLMTGADDGRVRLFAARTGRLLSDLQTTSTRLTQIGFASDGSIAFAIGLEGEVMAWRMPVRAPSGAELRAILSCRVPFVLQDGSLVKRPPTKETCPGSDGQKSRHAVH
jgi:WD40 repeat protein